MLIPNCEGCCYILELYCVPLINSHIPKHFSPLLFSSRANITSIMQDYPLSYLYPKFLQELIYFQGFNLANGSQNSITPITCTMSASFVISTCMSTYPKLNSFYPIPTLPTNSFPISTAAINDTTICPLT